MKNLKAWLATALLAVLATLPAAATELLEPLLDPDQCAVEQPENCLNGVTTAVTTVDALRVAGNRTADSLRESQEEKLGSGAVVWRDGGGSGLAAGDLGGGWGVWASYGRSNLRSDVTVAPYDASINSWTLGVDRLFAERFVVGLAVSYEDVSTSSFYNAGGSDSDGFTFAPYAAVLINDVFSVDVTGGYASLEYDQNRVDPAAPVGTRLLGAFDADRFFVAANVNALVTTGQWVFAARAGMLYTEEDQDAYTETGGPSARFVGARNVDLAQAMAGLDIGYGIGDFEPYATFAYRNDLGRDTGRAAGGLPSATGPTQADDDDEFEAGFGLRYFGDSGLSGTFEWIATLGRRRFDNNSFMMTLRLDL